MLGLGLGTLLFPLLSLYLGGRWFRISSCIRFKGLRDSFPCTYQGPQFTEGKLVLSFSWELEPSNLREGTRW